MTANRTPLTPNDDGGYTLPCGLCRVQFEQDASLGQVWDERAFLVTVAPHAHWDAAPACVHSELVVLGGTDKSGFYQACCHDCGRVQIVSFMDARDETAALQQRTGEEEGTK